MTRVNIVYTVFYHSNVEIVWDDEKNTWLKDIRGVSFEEIAGIMVAEEYHDLTEHPTRERQEYFVVSFHGYTWLFPFLVDDEGRIVLYTAYSSRVARTDRINYPESSLKSGDKPPTLRVRS